MLVKSTIKYKIFEWLESLQYQAYEVRVKKSVLRWMAILAAMMLALWLVVEAVSVQETKSFSSSDGDILNTPVADKIFGLLSRLTRQTEQDNRKEAVFYENIDTPENFAEAQTQDFQ